MLGAFVGNVAFQIMVLESALVVPQSICTVGIKRIGGIVVSPGIFSNSVAAC